MKKIVILVLATKAQGYDDMVRANQATWASHFDLANVKTLFIYGRNNDYMVKHNSTYRQDNLLISDAIDNVGHSRCCLQKTLMSFGWCLAHLDFDYVFRTTCASYINIDNLSQFIQTKPAQNYYCGIQGWFGCSGAGFFLSKDLVRVLFDYRWYLKRHYCGKTVRDIDDVVIGQTLTKKFGVPISDDARRMDCKTEKEIRSHFDPSHYHYFFTHKTSQVENEAAHRISLMKCVHELTLLQENRR